jgi:hypothetical protein
MENKSVLNHIVGRVLVQNISTDIRNIATFLTMLVCLLASQSACLSMWISLLSERGKAGSHIRRFTRWLGNSSIDPHVWYAPLFRYALRAWGDMPIYLALDTSMLYDRFCCVRISMICMNRAIPVTWCVLEHDSSTVQYVRYAHLFGQVEKLLPKGVKIFFLADRGFVCKKLMFCLQELGWTWRIRVKNNQKLKIRNGFITPKTLPLSPGKAILFSRNVNFGKGLENISLSAGWARGTQEPWYVLSGDGASIEVFMDYARRFGIEEGFRDEKSGGCELETSCIRDSQKLERLLLVIATALIVAVSEGTSVTLMGKREEVDPHHFRSLSYFQIGLRWIINCLWKNVKKLFGHCLLRPLDDTLPVASTKKESRRRQRMKNPAYLFRQVVLAL